MEDVLAESFGRPSIRTIRNWTDEELALNLVERYLHPSERHLAEVEQRNREAWAAPAGRAYNLSRWALAISVVALLAAAASAIGDWL